MKTTTRAAKPAPSAHATLLASGAHYAEDRRARARLFSDMLACFPAYAIRIVGAMGSSTLLIQQDVGTTETIFTLSDNGGEVNVFAVNASEPGRSAAYTASGRMVDGATLAYRVRMILTGEEIDYSLDLAGQLADLRAA